MYPFHPGVCACSSRRSESSTGAGFQPGWVKLPYKSGGFDLSCAWWALSFLLPHPWDSGAGWDLPKVCSLIFSCCWVLTHPQCETPGQFIQTGTSNLWNEGFFTEKDTRDFITLNNLHQFLCKISLCVDKPLKVDIIIIIIIPSKLWTS